MIDVLPRGPALAAAPWLLCRASPWRPRVGGRGGEHSSKGAGHGHQSPAPGGPLSSAVSLASGPTSLCLCFLLCRINTAIPPPSQGCPDKEVRQLMSSAGKRAREPGLQVQPWLHHPEQPSTRRPSGSPCKAKYTGLGVEVDLMLLEGLSASHSPHPQWLRSVLEDTVHLAASLPSTMDTICVLYMRKPRKVTLKSHPEASRLVFFVHLDLLAPFVNTAVSQSTWLFLCLHVCS